MPQPAMHACAPLPTRSREPSRTQSHQPQYRPHARVAHMRAIHTHATPMRAPSRSTYTSCLYHSTYAIVPIQRNPRTLLTTLYAYKHADPDVRTPSLLAPSALFATLPPTPL